MRKIIGICSIPECVKTIHCKGFCRSHYRKIFGENKKRYQIVKNNPELLEKYRLAEKRYKQGEIHRNKRKEQDKKYYLENKKKILEYKKRWNELKRFGTNRENILYRDGFKCILCDNTKDLIIHHKNGQGRCTDNPDNTPKNLVTLCRSCHMKIHQPNKLIEI
jgi:5-methylcytosine-specific restriction endonuclease McrA